MKKEEKIEIRVLEESDLGFVHRLRDQYSTMAYWFEEPYESLGELKTLYKTRILNEAERCFIVENEENVVGIVELVEINFIHRNYEIQIIIDHRFTNKGYAKATFEKAIHIYEKYHFKIEGAWREHFYTRERYNDSYIMGLLKKIG